MKKHSLKTISCILIALYSLPTLAEKIIKVTVKTSEHSAIAIGYSVLGKSAGTLGSSYSGKGPIGKKYSFGYRKKIKGADIDCGDITLKKDSVITLVTKDNKCVSVVTK